MTTTPEVSRPPAARGDAWELALFEGLRLGSGRAWRDLLDEHHAGMVRVARWYGRDEDDARRLVVEALAIALRGLDMFTWHGTFRSWLFGVLIDHGRGSRHRDRGSAASGLVLAAAGGDAPTARSLADLPWTSWWHAGSWPALLALVAALPTAQREALGLLDEEGWAAAEAQDALSLTTVDLERRTAAARGRVTTTLRGELGTVGREHDAAAVGRLLAVAPRAAVAPPDRALAAAFRHWRATRGLTVLRRISARRRAALRVPGPTLLPLR